MEFTNITLQEGIDRSKQDDHVMFDVREPYRFKQGHLQGALSMPYGVIKDQDAFRDKKIIVYCDFGGQSMLAARHLAEQGYGVYNIVGGIYYYRGELTSLGLKL